MPKLKENTTHGDVNEALRDAAFGRQAELAERFNARHVAHVEERWRRAFMAADPSATERDFEQALPAIRAATRRRAAVEGGAA